MLFVHKSKYKNSETRGRPLHGRVPWYYVDEGENGERLVLETSKAVLKMNRCPRDKLNAHNNMLRGLLSLSHNNIVPCLELLETDSYAFMVTNPGLSQTLEEYQRANNDKVNTKDAFISVCNDTLEAMRYLHDHNIILQTINPDTIFVVCDDNEKIVSAQIGAAPYNGQHLLNIHYNNIPRMVWVISSNMKQLGVKRIKNKHPRPGEFIDPESATSGTGADVYSFGKLLLWFASLEGGIKTTLQKSTLKKLDVIRRRCTAQSMARPSLFETRTLYDSAIEATAPRMSCQPLIIGSLIAIVAVSLVKQKE